MRILVIDDSPLHRASARQTLLGHDLTVIGTYDEGYDALKQPVVPREKVKAELVRRGFKDIYDGTKHSPEEIEAAKGAIAVISQELRPAPSFDAILCDLLMPAGRTTMGPTGMKYAGQEMPVGFALALMAVVYGAKLVAVATDTGHHDHPASAMLDPLNKSPFLVNGAKVCFYHSPLTLVGGTVCSKCGNSDKREECYCVDARSGSPKPECERCKGSGKYCWACHNSGKGQGKDWGAILSLLISSK